MMRDAIAAIHDDLVSTCGRSDVSWDIGAKWLATNVQAPPRVIWVPGPTVYSASENTTRNPRQLRTRAVRMMVHVWGGDPDNTGRPDATELLADQLVASIWRVAHGYFDLGNGQWASEDQSGWGNYGALYVFECVLKIPVTDEPYGQTTVETETITPVFAAVSGDITNPLGPWLTTPSIPRPPSRRRRLFAPCRTGLPARARPRSGCAPRVPDNAGLTLVGRSSTRPPMTPRCSRP